MKNYLWLIPAILWEWTRFNSRESGNEKSWESQAPGKREPGNKNTTWSVSMLASHLSLVYSVAPQRILKWGRGHTSYGTWQLMHWTTQDWMVCTIISSQTIFFSHL